jgi:hypothetical protein
MSHYSILNVLRLVPISKEEPLALVNGSPNWLKTLRYTGLFVAERRFGIMHRGLGRADVDITLAAWWLRLLI